MEYYLLDVFAEQKYSGNQLAVFICDDWPDVSVMLTIAKETDLAETAFLKLSVLDGIPQVRIFTVAYELPFAGHPTVGSAWLSQYLKPGSVFDRIITQAGQVPVVFPTDGQNGLVMIGLPQPKFSERYNARDIMTFTNLRVDDFSEDMLPQVVSAGISYLLVPLRSFDALDRVQVEYDAWVSFLSSSRLHETTNDSGRTTSLYFFSYNEDVSDKHSKSQPDRLAARMFCEEHMMPREDAATGSAAGCLLAYLLHIGSDSKLTITINQGQAIGRPSKLYAAGRKNDDVYELTVGGKVQLIAKGAWF